MNVKDTRKAWKSGDDARDAKKKAPEDVARIENISYGPARKWNKLDIYYPKTSEGKKIPTIVCCHGGGYFYGTKETYFFYCLDLARRGFRVVSYNYHLAPENKYPTPLKDSNMVMEFIIANQEKYHFDLDNLFLVGDSAGANLAAHLSLIYSNPEYQKTLPDIKFAPIKIKGAGLNCGFYDWNSILPNDPMLIRFIGRNLFKKYEESLNTIKYIDSRFPPVMVASCNQDFLLPCAEPFYKTLKERGVDARLNLYMPKLERLGHVHHVDVGKKWADKWNDEQLGFFKSLIG